MQYRVLGSTGLRVSVVGVGTWQFGGEWGHSFSQDEVDAILDQAQELGINLIDTAECYGDHLSETLIGDYLRRRNRSEWVIATKFGHRFHSFMNRTDDCSVEGAREQLDASLKALGVDSIDVYQFHSGTDEAFRNEQLWSMLGEQKRLGRVRFLGVSIRGTGSEMQAREAKSVGAEMLQVIYNVLDQRAERDYFGHAEHHNLGVFARVPLASGLLSGKYSSGATFSQGDYRSTVSREKIERDLAEVERIRTTELPPGVPMAQW
ncbi:MAG TPA: aldo/keto reductase, partial [Bryobacteraceae bacterium]|nr:aldo/keto reductase [Bryobacteraceae bacterium]